MAIPGSTQCLGITFGTFFVFVFLVIFSNNHFSCITTSCHTISNRQQKLLKLRVTSRMSGNSVANRDKVIFNQAIWNILLCSFIQYTVIVYRYYKVLRIISCIRASHKINHLKICTNVSCVGFVAFLVCLGLHSLLNVSMFTFCGNIENISRFHTKFTL